MEVLKFSGRQVHAKPLRAELDPRSSEDLASARVEAGCTIVGGQNEARVPEEKSA